VAATDWVDAGTLAGLIQTRHSAELTGLPQQPDGSAGRCTEAGATVPTFSREWGDYFPRTAMPPLRVSDFNMSTVSESQ
jgi:hypothetical protein